MTATQALAQALTQARHQAIKAVTQAVTADQAVTQALAAYVAAPTQARHQALTQARHQATQALTQAVKADQAVTQALAAYVAAPTQAQTRDLLTSQTIPETIEVWDALAESWRTVTVPAQPARRTATRRTRRPAQPRMPLAGAGSPLPSWWRDTAYAPSDGLADMRSHVAPAAIKTRRPATVIRWGDAGSFAGPDETF